MTENNSNALDQILLEEFSKPIPRGITQLALDLGFKDNSALLYHIRKLVSAGMLIRPRKGVYKTVLRENQANANLIQIPFYGEAKCGPDGRMLEEYPEYMIPLNIQVLRRNSKDLFALRAVGDSMLPNIREGDIVIAQKSKDPQLGSKDMYVVAHDNQILIKKVVKKGGSGFLISTNSDYEAIPINQEEFRIVGQVVSVFQNF